MLFRYRYASVAFAFILFNTPSLIFSAEPKDLQSLLQEAEKALLGKKPAPPKKAIPKTEKKEAHSEPAATELPAQKADSNPMLAPIDTTAIQKVIEVDLKATHREREPMYPLTRIGVGGGMHWLKPVYALTKDDDWIRNENGGQLQGFYFTFSPTWKLGFLEQSWGKFFLAGVFAAGYSQGNIVLQRSGIQTGSMGYGVKLIPIDAGVEVSMQFLKYFTAFVGYGPGLEIFHQDGLGINDSITDTFFGDEIWVGLRGDIFSSVQLFFSYKWKGTRLLLQSSNFGGQMLWVGASFGLSG